MLSTTTGQIGFFDAAELIGPAPEGSFFVLLAEHGERIVRDGDFADCYSESVGRPSIPPSQLAKVLLLQYRTGLSDEQAMEAVAWDLRWKIAVGLPVDQWGWNSSTLTRFRARLLLQGKERLALEATLELAGERGCSTPRRADRELDADARRGRHPGHRAAGALERKEADRRRRRQRRGRRPPARRRTRVRLREARPRSPAAAGGRSKSASGC